MATLVLQVAGAGLGSFFGPAGTMIGRAAGALAGSLIDKSLFGSSRTIEGATLTNARIPGAEEGTAIARVYGTARIGGTLIWATRFEEDATTERQGAKATGGDKLKTFSYFANFAVGLCEGPVAAIRRVWADGRELDLTTIEMRLHRGSENQSPDPLIEAKQGEGRTPAYRGLAYVVFERLPLDSFGNRIPVFHFEVIRPVGRLEKEVRAVTMIPGATEHGYATVKVKERTGDSSARIMNRNQMRTAADWETSIDELVAICPDLERVALVVSWFGTDLRAGHCKIVPGVETTHRDDESVVWRVSGHGRETAHLISENAGGPAYGGTPNDKSVLQAIADLKARGLKVFLYPFIMMDVPHGNDLPDPHGRNEQAPYPWRGRITAYPGPQMPGTADGKAAARQQVESFIGSASKGDFGLGNEEISYSGNDTGYRRMILHYAMLAKLAGGVDGFIIGSEMRGLTTLRDDNDAFPFVDALVSLADDVKSILPAGTAITYGADWSEYFGHHPQDGSGNVYFHLDPLWASPAITAVGIDNYMPLMDFRDADLSDVQPDGAGSADDVAAMQRAIASGEGYDWYYASEGDRQNRIRSPISDGLANKPWTFRYKDIENWWKNRHFDRVGGAELPAPTAWQAKMKPIWFTELGCPAIDRGANQPNVFVDRKSSESAIPYFSSGARSDATQRRFLEAHCLYWRGNGAPQGMVDPDHIFLWTWDSRPYPAFPELDDVFADGENWWTAHWLNGRLGAGTAADILAAILREAGIEDFDVSAVSGDLKGYVAGAQSSLRELLEPLLSAFTIDVAETDGKLAFRSRRSMSSPVKPVVEFAENGGDPLWQETIAQDGDFAGEAQLDYTAEVNEYSAASARSRRLMLSNDRVLKVMLPGVLHEEAAQNSAENLLRDNRLSRRQVAFSLPPTALALEPGDVVALPKGPAGRFLVTRIVDGASRRVEAREVATNAQGSAPARTPKRRTGTNPSQAYSPRIVFMDLPLYHDGEPEDCAAVAVGARPWKKTVLSVSSVVENYAQRSIALKPATMGRLTTAVPPYEATTALPDTVSVVSVRLTFGALSSVKRLELLNGANCGALQAVNGVWEIIGFERALEVDGNMFELTGLLRGLYGTEDATAAGFAADAPFVLLNEAVVPLGLKPSEMALSLNWLAEAGGRGGGKAGPFSYLGGKRAFTPLAPVHLDARRTGGNIALSWVRRGRIEADDWDGDDIPLDEDKEAYRLEILNAGAVVRTMNVSAPTALYTAAQEIADFGSARKSISFRVRQKGSRVALGLAAERTVILSN